MQQIDPKARTINLPIVIDGNLNVARLIEGLRSVGLGLRQDGKGNLAIADLHGGDNDA